MRAVVQRAKESHVRVDGETVGSISHGMVVLLAVAEEDGPQEVEYVSRKLAHLRIYPDGEGKMNRSLRDTGGQVLLVSQFTLYGDVRKGNRPGFSAAAGPEKAQELYEQVARALGKYGIMVQMGRFQTDMDLHITNDGPVTILLDSERAF